MSVPELHKRLEFLFFGGGGGGGWGVADQFPEEIP